jgi:glycyl-tRNA synthetase alpha subunit
LLPEELSVGAFDAIVKKSKAFNIGDEKKAESYANRHGGVVYTQVDAGRTVAYLKGFHLVNRNRYEVIVQAKEEHGKEAGENA